MTDKVTDNSDEKEEKEEIKDGEIHEFKDGLYIMCDADGSPFMFDGFGIFVEEGKAPFIPVFISVSKAGQVLGAQKLEGSVYRVKFEKVEEEKK